MARVTVFLPVRGGRPGRAGGPVWADRSETLSDLPEGFFQVCGHTPVDTVRTFEGDGRSITYIDCLENRLQFFELDTG